MSATESSISILACSVAIGWRPVGLADLGVLILNDTLNGSAHLVMIEAFRRSEAALVAPFKHSGLLWDIFFGFPLFGGLPDRWIIGGSVLVVGRSLYLLHRKHAAIPAPWPHHSEEVDILDVHGPGEPRRKLNR